MSNPIKYASRDFNSILADLNRDRELADKPAWFKRALAGIGDTISMWLDAEANNSVLRTAFTREAVHDLCALIDYELAPQATSSCEALFFLRDSTVLPVSLPASQLVATTRGTLASNPLRFEARGGLVIPDVSEVVNLTMNPPAGDAILVSRDYRTGEKVRVSGDVPAGLVAGSSYYAVRVDATHVRLSATLDGALAGDYLPVSGGSGLMTVSLRSVRAVLWQQESRPAQAIGEGDGTTGFLEMQIPDLNALRDTLTVEVGVDLWERVATLATSGPGDRHYQLVYNEDGSSFVRFGDGTYGAIPGNFEVTARYAVGGGLVSNVPARAVSTYAGTSADVEGVTNPSAASGGDAPESTERAKRVAPGRLKSRDRFITEGDGEALALGFGGSSLVRVISNAYGLLSAKVVCVAVGGGNLSPTARTALQEYLISRTVLESMDVRVEEAVITPHDVDCDVRVLPGFSWADVEPYVRAAWKAFMSEAGQEIVDAYVEGGDSAGVARFNSVLSEAFLEADPKVVRIIEGLRIYGARRFGETVQLSDAITLVQGSVSGVDFLTVSAPAFPISNDLDEIVTYGTVTLTEVP